MKRSRINSVHEQFFFSSRRRHTRSKRDWSSDVCSSDLLSLLRLAAEKGSASAEFNIGNLYNSGIGVERDSEAAVASFRRAADRGSAEACLRLEIGRASCRERVKSAVVAG